MRSVFLSALLEKSQVRSQYRVPRHVTLSFTNMLAALQGSSRSPSLAPPLSQNQVRMASAPRFISPAPISQQRSSSLVSAPRLIRDPRFLPPLSFNNSHIRTEQQNSSPVSPPSPELTAAPEQELTIKTYGTTIAATARQFGVAPELSLAVARAESGVGGSSEGEVFLNPRAVSSAGAVGLFQLMEATGKEQLREIAPGQRYNPFNPAQNIQLGVSYLREMQETFSQKTTLHKGLSTTAGANGQEAHRFAVAAYNAGPGRVARAQELARAQGQDSSHYRNVERYLPQETRQYVKKVERFAAEFRRDTPTLASHSPSLTAKNEV